MVGRDAVVVDVLCSLSVTWQARPVLCVVSERGEEGGRLLLTWAGLDDTMKGGNSCGVGRSGGGCGGGKKGLTWQRQSRAFQIWVAADRWTTTTWAYDYLNFLSKYAVMVQLT